MFTHVIIVSGKSPVVVIGSREGQCLRWKRKCNFQLFWDLKSHGSTGREIAPNTGANVTKFFTLATKS